MKSVSIRKANVTELDPGLDDSFAMLSSISRLRQADIPMVVDQKVAECLSNIYKSMHSPHFLVITLCVPKRQLQYLVLPLESTERRKKW